MFDSCQYAHFGFTVKSYFARILAVYWTSPVLAFHDWRRRFSALIRVSPQQTPSGAIRPQLRFVNFSFLNTQAIG